MHVTLCLGFLRNTGPDPHEKHLGLTASRGRPVRPCMKYVDDLKNPENDGISEGLGGGLVFTIH